MESAPQNARKNQGKGNRRHLFSASIPSPPASAMDGWVRPRWMISRKGYAKAPKKNDFICFASKIIFSGAANNYPQVCTDNLENKKTPSKGSAGFLRESARGTFFFKRKSLSQFPILFSSFHRFDDAAAQAYIAVIENGALTGGYSALGLVKSKM